MEDILSMCRLCLDPISGVASKLFPTKNGLSFASQIMDMLGIELEDTPNWPQKCCVQCIQFLVQMKKFQRDILSNHKEQISTRRRTGQGIVDLRCRLCLMDLTSKNGVNLFVSHERVIFADLILEMMNVELEDTPHWPRKGCLKCIDFLKLVPLFQQQILTSHKVFYDHFHGSEEMAVLLHYSGQDSPEEISPDPHKSEDSIVTSEEKDSTTEAVIEDRPGQVSPTEEEDNETKALDSELFDTIDEGELSEIIDLDSSNLSSEDCKEEVPPVTNKNSSAAAPSKSKHVSVKRKATRTKSPVLSVVRVSDHPTAEELKLEALMLEMKIFNCNICDVDTKTLSGLQKHLKGEHKNSYKEYKICCDFAILKNCSTMVYDHFRLHLDKDAFKCQECGKLMKNSSYLKQHIKDFHSKEPPSHICNVCGKGFNERMYRKHMRTHEEKLKCQYCRKGYSSKAILTDHIKMEHEVEVNSLCHICGRGFPSTKRLSVHIMDHGGPHGGNKRKKPKIQYKAPVEFDDNYFQK